MVFSTLRFLLGHRRYLTGFSLEGRRTKTKSPPSCPEFLT